MFSAFLLCATNQTAIQQGLLASMRKSPKDKHQGKKAEPVVASAESPIGGAHVKPYEYTENQGDATSPTRRNYTPGGFRYDEDPSERPRSNDSDQLSPNSQARRNTALAFNYAPGEEDKLKKKAGELSPRSKTKSYSPNTTSGKSSPAPGATAGSYKPVVGDPTNFLDGERLANLLQAAPGISNEPTKKLVKILVIVSKFDPKTKRIDASSGTLEHSTGILDTATGKIETKYGLINPKTGAVEHVDDRTGKPATFQGTVEPKSGNIHLTSGVISPTTHKIDDTLGQIICIAPPDSTVVDITAITGKVNQTTGRIDTVNGDVERSTGVLNLKTGIIDTKYGQINPLTGETKLVDPKSGKSTSRSATVDPITGHITIVGVTDARTGKQDNQLGHLVAVGQQIDPIVEVISLSGKLDAKKGIIEASTLVVDSSTGLASHNNSRVDTKYGQINLVKHTILITDPKSGKTEVKDFKVDPLTGQLIIKGGFNPTTGKPDKDYGQILSIKSLGNQLVDSATGKVVAATDPKNVYVDPKTNQIWVAGPKDAKSGETIYSSSLVDPKTGHITIVYGYLSPKTNEIERQTKLDDNVTRVDPVSGQLYTATGEVEDEEPVFAVSHVEAGNLVTKVAKVDPKTGKLTIIRITPLFHTAEPIVEVTTAPSKPIAEVVAPKTPKTPSLPAAKAATPPAAPKTPTKGIATESDAFIPVAAAQPTDVAENPVIEVVTLIGTLDQKTGKIDAKTATIERTRGILNIKTGFVHTKYGHIHPATGECRLIDPKTGAINSVKKAHVDPFTGQITIKGVVDPKTGKLEQQLTQQLTFGPAINPIVEVTSIAGRLDAKKGIIDAKTASVEKTIGQLDRDSGDIVTALGVFDLKNGTVSVKNPKTGKTETKEFKVDPVTGQLLLKNEINPKTGKPDKDLARIVSLRIVNRQLDPATGQEAIGHSDAGDVIVDPKTNQLWVPHGTDPVNGNTIYTSSQIDPKTGYIITIYGYLNPKTRDIDRQTSVESSTTKIDPISGQVFSATGELDSATGEPLFAASQVDPDSGEVYTKVGRIDPKTGKLVLIKIVLITKRDHLGRPQEVDPATCDVDQVTGRIRNIFNKTVYVYNMVDPVTGEIVQVDPNDPRVAGARTTVTQTMTLSGEIDEVTGRIKTEYGHIDPETGDIDPATAVLDPVTGKLILNYAQIDPSHFGKEVTVTKETVPITRDQFMDGIKHLGANALRRDSEASSDEDVAAYGANANGATSGKVSKYVSAPTVVKTTTKQVMTKNEDGVTHNVEEEIRNLGTGEVVFSTQEHKVGGKGGRVVVCALRAIECLCVLIVVV